MAITEFPGNAIPAPGFRRGNNTTDDELLYSHNRFTQKGVTLEPGQGVLTLGTVLSRDPATKRWGAAPEFGDGVARGVLRQTVDTGTDEDGPVFQNNIVISGILKVEKITVGGAPIADGDPAIAALNARVDRVMGTFTL